MKTYLKSIFLILTVLISGVSALAASVNQDASVTNGLTCSANPDNVIKWKADGVYQTQFENYFEIDSSYLTKGETWTCEEYELIYNPLTYNFNTNLVGAANSVIRNSAPVIVPSGALITLNGLPSTPFSYDVDATDADADTLSYSLSAITPAAPILINSNTGLLTWLSPIAGTYLFSVTARDSGYGATSVTQNYRLIISGTAPTPLSVIVSGNPISGPVPLAVAFTAIAAGGIAPFTYRWDFTNDGTYDATNISSVAVQNNNIYSATGSYTARVQVTDSVGSVAQNTVTISVTTLTSTSIVFSTTSCPEAEEDKSYTCDIDATGTGTLQYSLIGAPNGMTINQNTGVISWTPSNSGDFTFTVRATDVASLVSRDQVIILTVNKNEVTNEFVFIDSIVFEQESYSPGETAVALVTVRNEEDFTIQDLKIDLFMETSGVKATSAKFNLQGSSKKTIKVSLELPSILSSSSEWIKVTLIGDNIRIARYRSLDFSGVSLGTTELVIKPTSLPAYSDSNKEQKLNWFGVWFVLLLFLLLLGVAAYIVKGMADDKKRKVKFTKLDNQF
ncbi:MAG: putative Ig domain-containing protein [Nanoarchaeota archaeon]